MHKKCYQQKCAAKTSGFLEFRNDNSTLYFIMAIEAVNHFKISPFGQGLEDK